MAAPTWQSTIRENVITATSGAVTTANTLVLNDVVLLAVLQDGTGANATVSGINAAVSDLSGTTSALTAFTGNPYNVGNPTAAKLLCWIGRMNSTLAAGGTIFTLNSSAGDDLYFIAEEFHDVNTGSGLSAVVENGSAGTINSDAATSTSVADVGVTTLGTDRLAINLVGINDDATGIAAYVGASGGTWAMPNSFESATGTDGTVALMTAAMASAGTINGGTAAITSDGWGVTGFALIGTTVAAAAVVTRDPWPALQAVNRSNVY